MPNYQYIGTQPAKADGKYTFRVPATGYSIEHTDQPFFVDPAETFVIKALDYHADATTGELDYTEVV